jgi:DNA repair photolyase
MRWDNLTVESEESRTLPGYREPAMVRTFDAPEAMDVRFYEVRAKSALNRVPKASRVPFRWTINPYRGCTHACVYCTLGSTPVLMADGRPKPIADLRKGDWIYGTVRQGAYRRYRATQVLAHWSTIKPAYRITLEDGTELVASGDHRFLTGRGWKHVTGADGGPGQRPHLTLNDKLIGTGAYPEPPEDWPDYRRGYLCGLIRGDGHLSSRPYESRDGRIQELHRFRLALTDREALDRARQYLREERGLLTQEFAFATSGRLSMRAIRTQSSDGVATVTELIQWPRSPRPEWRKGFLAGIFDAEGSSREVVRISNADPQIIDWICSSLRVLGFMFVVEDPPRSNGLQVVRLLGGLKEKLRFFITVDPAINRKRDIEGIALKSPGRLTVESIEPLGKGFRLYDITTGTGDFMANGVVSHNCFARPTHRYLDFDAGRDFEREIVVKVNVPEVARSELMRPSWKREHVALGTNTDPYQWVESRYRLMPGIWEAMRDSRTPCSVLTKSPLLLRDLDLMKEINERVGFAANLSIPTLDEKAWRATEPHTPHPRKRIEAVAEINRAGVPCGVLIAPLIPGINDDPTQVEKILELCAEAGAVNVGGICLHLRGEVKDLWMDWLNANRPDLIPRYEKLYARSAYAPKAEQERLTALARPGARITPGSDGGAEPPPGGRSGGPEPPPAGRSEPPDARSRSRRSETPRDTDPITTPPPREPEQTTLF